jgi:predicted nucleic acid-binding protein
MTPVFADTFYYLALLNADDDQHERAAALTASLAGRIVTTDWVVTELADGLCRANTRGLLTRFVRDLFADPDVTIIPADRPLWEKRLDLYERRPDKEWSLTDCISFVVMEREGITEALTADHHFEQAGFIALLKSG